MLRYLGRKGELAIGKMQAGARVAPGSWQTAKAEEFHLCLLLCSLREEPVFSAGDQQRGEENQTPTTSQKIRYPGQFSLCPMHVPSLGQVSSVTCISKRRIPRDLGISQLPGELQGLPWLGGMAGAPGTWCHPVPYQGHRTCSARQG